MFKFKKPEIENTLYFDFSFFLAIMYGKKHRFKKFKANLMSSMLTTQPP